MKELNNFITDHFFVSVMYLDDILCIASSHSKYLKNLQCLNLNRWVLLLIFPKVASSGEKVQIFKICEKFSLELLPTVPLETL